MQHKKGGRYLDIGCGTGNYTHVLQNNGFQFIGIDPSIEMLEKAKQKNSQIEWQIGTAEKTNLTDKSVNGVMAFLTIHHWSDLKKSFEELHRVMKANSRIVVFTSTPKQMKEYWLNHYFPKMLQDSILQMPTLEKVTAAMRDADIEVIRLQNYSVHPDLQDQFLYCGKEHPELYFKEEVRNGISSFSSLANQQEVEEGLKELRKDIDNGKIEEISQSYANDLGDYLFIVGRAL